jgi:hypothetical protein
MLGENLRCERELINGNLLKQIVTRIDYKDIFELRCLKELSLECGKLGLTENLVRMLDPSDFQTNDPILLLNSMPNNFVTSIKSYLFENEIFSLEVNQLFLKLTQTVDTEYKRYGETLKIIESVLKLLHSCGDLEDFRLKRISVKKGNEVFFNSIEQFQYFFKPEILPFSNYDKDINWAKLNSRSQVVENFFTRIGNVNLTRIYDTGVVLDQSGEVDKKLYRIFLELEAYDDKLEYQDNLFESAVVEKLESLNSLIYYLFEGCLSDLGVEQLKNGEKVGEII